jgi:hypothetical protein
LEASGSPDSFIRLPQRGRIVLELLGGSVASAFFLGLAALIIGYSKTALGGLAALAVVIFATVFPAKVSLSTGAGSGVTV